MKVAIINDTQVGMHFGTRMVMAAYRKLLKDRRVELVGTLKRGVLWGDKSSRKLLDKADLIIVNGEGSLHHNGFSYLLAVAAQYPSILMNSVFQDMSSAYQKLKQFRHIAVRESMSADHMYATYRIRPEVIPDMSFALHGTLPQFAGNGRDFFFSDSVIRDGIYTHSAFDRRFVENMAAHKRACCGRFHAICVAAMIGIPFSAWRSNTWKNKAIMLDMGIPELYAHTQSDAFMLVPDSASDSVADYAHKAVKKINNLFDRIANGKI